MTWVRFEFSWAIGLLALLTACGEPGPSPAPAVMQDEGGDGLLALTPAQRSRAGVVVQPVTSGEVAEIVSLPGRVVADPRGRVVVTSKLDGIVRRIDAFRGDVVEAGAVVAALESVPLARARSTFARARARVASATKQRDAETALAERRRETLKRYHDGVVEVLEDAERREGIAAKQKLTSRRKWLDARQALALARLERDEALEVVRTEDARRRLLREREVAEAQRDLAAAGAVLTGLGEEPEGVGEAGPGAFVLRAAKGGTVVSVDCTPGEFVRAGEHLLTVRSGVRVVGAAFEHQIPSLRPEARATVRFDALMSERAARVESFGAEVDMTTRALDVWFELLPPDSGGPDVRSLRLRPGLFAHVDLAVAPHHADVVVPKTAVVAEGSRRYVFVVRGATGEEERFERVIVSGRPVDGDRFEVTHGLAETDRVVVRGLFPLMSLARGEELEE